MTVEKLELVMLIDISPPAQGVDHRQVQKELGDVLVRLHTPVVLTPTTVQVTWTVSCFCFLHLFVFLGLHPQHMEVPRRGVKLELQLLVYTTATATRDSSCICDLHTAHGNASSLTD